LRWEGDRLGNVFVCVDEVRRVTIGTANIVAPVFSATEIVVLFSTGMAGKTRLRNFFRSLVLERDDLRRVAFFCVSLAWPMTRFASGYLVFPASDFGESGVRGMRKRLELILVASLTNFSANVIVRLGCRGFILVERY